MARGRGTGSGLVGLADLGSDGFIGAMGLLVVVCSSLGSVWVKELLRFALRALPDRFVERRMCGLGLWAL